MNQEERPSTPVEVAEAEVDLCEQSFDDCVDTDGLPPELKDIVKHFWMRAWSEGMRRGVSIGANRAMESARKAIREVCDGH